MSATEQMAPVALADGDEGPTKTVGPLVRMDFVRYAGAGGDFNPMHTDEEFAKSAGMPSVFGHGLLTAGIGSVYLAEWVGRTNVRKYGFRLASQVWPGDELTFRGKVERVHQEDGTQLADLSIVATRQTGEPALTATATVVAS